MSKSYNRFEYGLYQKAISYASGTHPEPRRFMQILAGPRQVGKTTLVGQVLDKISIPYSLEMADAVDPKDSD